MRASLIAALTLVSACATTGAERGALEPGTKYVAMGSSFAGGAGVTTSADTPPTRCQRSIDNYPHQLARRHGLQLVDVSCGGATTAHILGPWNELPAQIDAVDAATRLVTITIGGNDIGYMAGLFTATTCTRGGNANCPATSPTEQAYADVEQHMEEIARAVRQRAPQARLVFVDYLTVLPPSGTCAATPVGEAQADASRALARRLEEITARVAARNGADVLRVSALSRDHSACATAPWVHGFVERGSDGTSYHPNLEGTNAVANALDELIAP